MASDLLTLLNISFVEGENRVLTNINLSQSANKKIVIAGETGSGKSTLLKIIAGLQQPTSGEVIFNHEKVKGPSEQLVPGHPSIAYLSQHFELQKSLRVEQVLEYANTLSPTTKRKIFSICRINHLLKRRTDELSGGEKQRIAIARLLIQQPMLLLLDEPFSNLDRILKGILKSIIDDIGRKLKITCILVSHDPEDTLPWADEIIVLKRGKIIQRGSPVDIYKKPIDKYVAGLFGPYSVLENYWIKKFGLRMTTKEVIVRPEDFEITQKRSNTVQAVVEKISFYGNYQLLEVAAKEKHFLVTSSNYKQPGAIVHLKIKF